MCEIRVAQPDSHPISEAEFAALKHLVQDLGLPVFESATEADVHFARQWSDAKLKAAIDQYLSGEPRQGDLDELYRGEQLQGLGERIHPFLLAYLAAENPPADKSRLATRLGRLCYLLGDDPPPSVIPLLAPFLDEANPSLRCDAAATIAKTGAPEIGPFVRKALADSGRSMAHWANILDGKDGRSVAACALGGLQMTMDRGDLHADLKGQLFPDVKVSLDRVHSEEWAKALIGLDPVKALEHFLSGGFLMADHRDLSIILTASVEANLQIPREHLLNLLAELKSPGLDPDHERWRLGPTLVLLGQHHHPDDLELFQSMSDSELANHAMPGLLAWHGIHGYRERLSKQVQEKGYGNLNENQRLHFAASEFTEKAHYYFWYPYGEHWRDALAGLKAMKRDQSAALREQTAAKFGPDGPSADLETRKAQFDTLRKKEVFTSFESGVVDAADPKDLSFDRFAIEHEESFK